MTHFDPTRRGRCKFAKPDDKFAAVGRDAVLYVDCPHCRKKPSFKRLDRIYTVEVRKDGYGREFRVVVNREAQRLAKQLRKDP